VWMGTEDADDRGDLDSGVEEEETFCTWLACGGRPKSWSSLVSSHGVSVLSVEEAMGMVNRGISEQSTGSIVREVGEGICVSTPRAYVRVTWTEWLGERWPALIDGVLQYVCGLAAPDDVRIVAMHVDDR
jgi:hypothetical protein